MFLQRYMTLMYWIYLGEALHTKLQRIEKEQQKAVTMIGHSVLALHSQHEELKDSHFRLEKTQDQIHFELKEQIAILGEENEELDRKYQKSVDKYNIERTKSEQQEKYKVSIFHNVLLIYYQGKQKEYRCVIKKRLNQIFSLERAFFLLDTVTLVLHYSNKLEHFSWHFWVDEDTRYNYIFYYLTNVLKKFTCGSLANDPHIPTV